LSRFSRLLASPKAANACKKGEYAMNSPLEYILVGIVALAILVYLMIALLKPELF
jgi:F subunit of K+-transporting ATPase (Potass_KdpF)